MCIGVSVCVLFGFVLEYIVYTKSKVRNQRMDNNQKKKNQNNKENTESI